MELLNRLRAHKKQREESDNGDPVVVTLIIIGVMTITALLIYLAVGDALLEEQERGEGGSSVSNEQESEPTPAPEPAEPINWNPLIIGAGGLLGLATLGGGGFAVVKGIGSARARKNTRAQEVAVYESIASRHQDVLVQYSAYETDLWKALTYPALHDVEVKETANFLKAMRDADSIKKTTQDRKEKLDWELRNKYETAVSELENTFTIAENKAIRLGEGNMSEDERKDMKTARMLLSHAEDSGNNAEMRANYYEQLRRVINRLNERHRTPIIPQLSVDQIEHKSRLLLTDGDDDSNSLLSNNLLDETKERGQRVRR